jgi:glutamyl-tRNA synthetase
VPGPRVRFAPSPTGFFHVGSARTALFNWFVARQSQDASFILRIEDTDESRNREEWIDGIVSAMEWLGMRADEGPYLQSDHDDEHRAAVGALFGAGRLYLCDCTTEDVRARKPEGAPPGYDGYCRTRSVAPGPRAAYRFATPREGTTVVNDLIRGEVEFANEHIEDFVVAKPSGAVLWALGNVVDDRRDLVSHVIRGEEHLPNTPKQILMWLALDDVSGQRCELPAFAHVPVLVNEQRKKLSKRRDPVALEMYRDQGYLPEALANYLSLLGWSPRGDEEKVPLATCVQQFRLADVSHSPAFFDVKKLTHLNGEYIRELSVEQFVERAAPWVRPTEGSWSSSEPPPWEPSKFDPDVFARMAPFIKERVSRLDEVTEMVDFLFVDEPTIDESAFAKSIAGDPLASAVLAGAVEAYNALGDWSSDEIHHCTVEVGESLGLSLRKAQAPIRCAVTGRSVGPPLFESLELLGRERTISRLRSARARTEA